MPLISLAMYKDNQRGEMIVMINYPTATYLALMTKLISFNSKHKIRTVEKSKAYVKYTMASRPLFTGTVGSSPVELSVIYMKVCQSRNDFRTHKVSSFCLLATTNVFVILSILGGCSCEPSILIASKLTLRGFRYFSVKTTLKNMPMLMNAPRAIQMRCNFRDGANDNRNIDISSFITTRTNVGKKKKQR